MKSAPNTLLKSSCASWASFSWCATNSSHSRDFLLARLNPPAVLSNARDRKSTRLNSSHSQISYAVFCLKKKIQHQAGRLEVEQVVEAEPDSVSMDAAQRERLRNRLFDPRGGGGRVQLDALANSLDCCDF